MMKRTMIRLFAITCLMLSLTPAVFALPKSEQRPDAFADASSVAPGLMVEMRYAGSHNFVGAPIDGYQKPICYLTRPAAAALANVVADLESRGLTIKVFDC